MHDGHLYSNKAPALAFVAAVPYALLVAVHGAPASALDRSESCDSASRFLATAALTQITDASLVV